SGLGFDDAGEGARIAVGPSMDQMRFVETKQVNPRARCMNSQAAGRSLPSSRRKPGSIFLGESRMDSGLRRNDDQEPPGTRHTERAEWRPNPIPKSARQY